MEAVGTLYSVDSLPNCFSINFLSNNKSLFADVKERVLSLNQKFFFARISIDNNG
jgi:hypothetical protein